ncbi:MAG: agmatinase [Thermoproteales archaeon]|nr:agmatinase [Thermoproteales archaeon]
MSLRNLDFYLHKREVFFGGVKGAGADVFKLIGVPLEMTVSFRGGTALAPSKIRDMSLNIESYSLSFSVDFDDIGVDDLGDIEMVPGNLGKSLKRINDVVKEILQLGENVRIIILGGEHTLTLPAFKALNGSEGEGSLLVVADAHLDLRDEYPLGVSISHATVMRRIHEELKPDIVFLGTRAVSKEELIYAKEHGLTFFTPGKFVKGIEYLEKSLKNNDYTSIYLSLDFDVFDPAYAPGVGNPEPGGITLRELYPLLELLADYPLKVIDLVEITPLFDPGNLTSILAAKIVEEIVCCLWSKLK